MDAVREGYIKGFDRILLWHKKNYPSRGVNALCDFAIEYCENHDLHEDFVQCKLDPFALYAVYKCDGDTEKLKRYVEASNKSLAVRQNRERSKS